MSAELWYVRDRNRIIGPFNGDQLDAMRRRGQLSRFHQVSHDRQSWVSATTLRGVFSSALPTSITEIVPAGVAAPALSAACWYYATEKDPIGPVCAEDLIALLRSGTLNAETIVWKEGMSTWVMLRESGLLLGNENPATPHAQQPSSEPPKKFICYASVGARLMALIIDGILVVAVIGTLVALVELVFINETTSPVHALRGLFLVSLLSIVLETAYFAGMESSRYQATLGKIAMGIRVTDLSGDRISLGRAIGRFLSKHFLSSFCLIGYIMALITEKNQALHDKIASTLVVR